MKKFLFTLVGLLMAGSLCAEEYMYINDFEVSQEFLAQTSAKQRRMDVTVYAHFEAMVSAWQVNLTLPEGITLKNCEALEGMTIHGLNALGMPKDYPVALSNNLENAAFIGASTEAGYYYPEGSDPDEDDPVTCGANKWMPGEYTMFSVTLQFDQDFAGGEIVVVTQPASGEDPRPGVCEPGQINTRVTNVTVEGGVVEPQDLTGEIVVSEPTEEGIVTVSYNGDEDVTIKVNGEAYNGEEIQLVEGENVLVVTVEAEGYNTLEETFTITWTAPIVGPQDLTGEIIIGDADENGYVAIEYTGDEDVTIKVMVDGIYVPYVDGQIFLGAYGEAEVTVEVSAEGYNTLTATKIVNWEEPVLETLTGEIVVGEPDENGVVNVTYTGDEDVTITITVNGEVVEGDVVLGEGENVIVVTVEAAGYETMEQTFVVTWTAPVVLETLTGEIVVSEPDENGFVTVTYTGDEDVTILVNGEPYEGQVQLNDGENTIVVTVEAAGYETLEETFVIEWTAPQPPYDTPAPEISTELTDDAFVITAVGEGMVTIYVQTIDNETGEMTVNSYVGDGTAVATIARGEETFFINYWAAAQRDDDANPGITGVTYYVEVPALEVLPPVVEGVVLIMIDQNGNEHPFNLSQGEDGDFATTVTLDYVPFGQFYWDPMLSDAENEANRPNVPFYFMINGQRYGVEGEVAAVLGFAMQNPLDAEADGCYTVPVGYSYTLGLAQKDGVYYVYAAVSTPTGVDELNANKAVAGVRYFNMAGQEMQEANGMTIVVTTYTDGTTSTAKVMK